MTSSQAVEACRECQARHEWVGFNDRFAFWRSVWSWYGCEHHAVCLISGLPLLLVRGEVRDKGKKAALVPALHLMLAVPFPRWVWSSIGARQGGSPGRSAAGCGGRGSLPVMSHAGAVQDAAVCGSRGDAEQRKL